MTPALARLIEDLEELRDVHADTGDDENTFTRLDRRARRETFDTAIRMVRYAGPKIEEAAVVAASLAGVR